MNFYKYSLRTKDYKNSKDFNDYYFEKMSTIFPKKDFNDVLEELKNARKVDLHSKIRVDNVVFGYIWEKEECYFGTLYLNEDYEDCLRGSRIDLKLLEDNIVKKGLPSDSEESKIEVRYKELSYNGFEELLNIIGEELNSNYPIDLVQKKATNDQIKDAEIRLGVKLPESYKKFLCQIADGIVLFNAEPIVSTEELSKTKDGFEVYLSMPMIKTKIKDVGEIDSDKLVSFTHGEFMDSSANQWVFICDKEYPDNEYPVGYITQSKGIIVRVLEEGFKEWLETFWKGYEFGEYKSVFSILHPNWDEMSELWDYSEDEDNSASTDSTQLFDNRYHGAIYGDTWERKYEIEIKNLETKEITKLNLPAINGGKLKREEFENNLPKEFRIVSFMEYINEKFK